MYSNLFTTKYRNMEIFLVRKGRINLQVKVLSTTIVGLQHEIINLKNQAAHTWKTFFSSNIYNTHLQFYIHLCTVGCHEQSTHNLHIIAHVASINTVHYHSRAHTQTKMHTRNKNATKSNLWLRKLNEPCTWRGQYTCIPIVFSIQEKPIVFPSSHKKSVHSSMNIV
jgi:hypothetical protein